MHSTGGGGGRGGLFKLGGGVRDLCSFGGGGRLDGGVFDLDAFVESLFTLCDGGVIVRFVVVGLCRGDVCFGESGGDVTIVRSGFCVTFGGTSTTAGSFVVFDGFFVALVVFVVCFGVGRRLGGVSCSIIDGCLAVLVGTLGGIRSDFFVVSVW